MSTLLRVAIVGLWVMGCGSDPPGNAGGHGGEAAAGGAGAQPNAGGSGGADDGVPPGAPADLTIALSTTPYGAALSWTPPSDADVAGYLVVRAPAAADLAALSPSDGTFYTPVDTFAPGVVVAAVSPGPSVLDAALPLERESHYAVWAFDGGGLYGPPATGSISVGFPPQTATLEIHDPTGNPTVTIGAQPTHTLLAASASFNDPQLVVTLSVANSSHRVWFNPKVIINQVSDAAAVPQADGTMLDGRVMDYLGPTPLGVGSFKNSTLRFTGVTADPLVVDVAIEGSEALITGNIQYFRGICIYDLSGARDADGRGFGGPVTVEGVTKPYQDAGGSGFQLRGGLFSPDGRHMVMSRGRNAPWFERIDLTTGQTTPSTPLASDGYLSRPVASDDGQHVYVALYAGGRNKRDGMGEHTDGQIALVRVDRQTLEETGRAVLVDPGTHQGGAEVALSPDQTTVAVPLRDTQSLALVDVTTMTVIDTDPLAPGTQHIALPFACSSPVFSQDGSKVYAAETSGYAGGGAVAVVDLSDFSVSELGSLGASGWIGEVAVGPDGRMWVGHMSAPISVVDVSADETTEIANNDSYTRAIVFHRGSAWTFDAYDHRIQRWDPLTLQEQDTDGNTANGITPLRVDHFFCWPTHGAVITPF